MTSSLFESSTLASGITTALFTTALLFPPIYGIFFIMKDSEVYGLAIFAAALGTFIGATILYAKSVARAHEREQLENDGATRGILINGTGREKVIKSVHWGKHTVNYYDDHR
ncbi:hypothetical protein ABW21_db0202703 [Orbilia brochopaga]|nr:hypothetical protein ABW21_db0202703 [Drechslerella brochopaga]